jgi:hypothetical protein
VAPAKRIGHSKAVASLSIDELGGSPHRAVRRLLTEFRSCRWHDVDQTAARIVDRLEVSTSVSSRILARQASTAFLAQNRIQRGQLESMLERLSHEPGAPSGTSRRG